MNANKLADEVEMWGRDLLALNMKGGVPVIEGARLLRQQQAEIEALKQIIDANNLSQNIGQFLKAANEPVAWMLADKEAEHIRSIMAVQHDFVPKGCVEIPLYTHPVKELTDEEIWELSDMVLNNSDVIGFAKAILRKAIAGSENVATASWVIKQQLEEIEYWKQMFEKAMEAQEK